MIEEKLKNIFENVNSWLLYAETKNATLIAFNSAVFLGIIAIIKDTCIKNNLIFYYVLSILFQLFIGLIISLFSFIPRNKIPLIRGNKSIHKNDNILYHGHISKYTENKYLKNLLEKMGIQDYEASDFEKDYINQIIINSKIANYKYECFSFAIIFTLSAFLSPIVFIILVICFIYSLRKS